MYLTAQTFMFETEGSVRTFISILKEYKMKNKKIKGSNQGSNEKRLQIESSVTS